MTERLLAAIATDDSQGASEQELDAAGAALGIELPEDYRAVMRQANGAECEFGDSWVRLWPVEELVEKNAVWREFQRPCTFFGTDGGGFGYAWDGREGRAGNYVALDWVNADPDAAVPCGETFEEFLAVLHSGIPFERLGE
jgi:cell wall assembly regulator SMI1